MMGHTVSKVGGARLHDRVYANPEQKGCGYMIEYILAWTIGVRSLDTVYGLRENRSSFA